jgi:predicted regulator of Ras-like GTPase activity (Roadblock/LC7/MglB family)
MPFQYLLTNLMVDVPGAHGAIFLDPEGEFVEYVTRRSTPYELKVEGAYHGLLLRSAGRLLRGAGGGQVVQLMVAGTQLKVLSRQLKNGYYLVLVMEPEAPLGFASRAVEATAQALNQEIP